jgi:hypothetical protein
VNQRERKNRKMRKTAHEELHNLYSLPNIRVMKSRMMGWAGHVACFGEMKRNAHTV